MGQISEVEEKPFTSSLNVYSEACCGNRVGSRRSNASIQHLSPSSHSVDISLKDDVSVILLIDVSTEYTELQPLLSGVHSVMRVKLVLASEGGGCTPTPSLYIYHHQRRYDMNGRFQMQGGKNWILPK